MVFSSMTFLWLFLPTVLIGYWLLGLFDLPNSLRARSLGTRLQNLWLLAMSLLFYAWGEPKFVFVMTASILLNYLGGLAVGRIPAGVAKKAALALVVLCNLAILGYFKYFQTAAEMLGHVTGVDIASALNIVLPIGISFYTFQALSYVIDVYRGVSVPQKNLLLVALYITLFPQLVAGPIVKYGEIEEQLRSRTVTADKTIQGIKRFIYGLCKKVIIANQLALVVDEVFALESQDLSTALAWAGILFYALQIFFDFSGYSDMAIGLGLIFGFRFPENFNLPYISWSIREFWRRWHISLSSWFKEYVYIPLGGNRKGRARTYFNLLVVFFVTGIWHGAGLAFIVWGLYHGLFMIIERLGLGRALDGLKGPWRALSHVYALLVVVVGWVFFRAASLSLSITYLEAMFTPHGSYAYNFFEIVGTEAIVVFAIGVLMCGPLQIAWSKLKGKEVTDFLISYLQPKVGEDVSELVAEPSHGNGTAIVAGRIAQFAMLLALFAVCVVLLSASSYNPFIYFRF